MSNRSLSLSMHVEYVFYRINSSRSSNLSAVHMCVSFAPIISLAHTHKHNYKIFVATHINIMGSKNTKLHRSDNLISLYFIKLLKSPPHIILHRRLCFWTLFPIRNLVNQNAISSNHMTHAHTGKSFIHKHKNSTLGDKKAEREQAKRERERIKRTRDKFTVVIYSLIIINSGSCLCGVCVFARECSR